MKAKLINYKNFSLDKINTPEFHHLKYIIYWPLMGICFGFLERIRNVDYYHPVHCFLDDLIPFNEFFMIPYMFWFVYLFTAFAYLLLFDSETWIDAMKFVIITYTTALVIYFIYPTCQNLRPVEFERDNILTRFMVRFYKFDTNTNVCPSIHVLGSVAAMYAYWYSKDFSNWKCRLISTILAVVISISTVFVKQHSIIDVFFAIPLCIFAWIFCNATSCKKNKLNSNVSVELNK